MRELSFPTNELASRSAVRNRHSGWWSALAGPAITAGAALIVELLRDTPLRIATPPALFNLSIVIAGFTGGIRPALVSAAIAWCYTAFFFLGPEISSAAGVSDDNVRRLVVWAAAMPLAGWLVGVLNRRAAQALAQAKLAALEQTQAQERARASEALRRSEAYLTEAQKMSHAGSWALNVANRQFVHWSQEYARLHGLESGADVLSWTTIEQQIHPGDRTRCAEQMDRALRGEAEWSVEYRCVLPEGDTRVFRSIARLVGDPDGDPVELVGTDVDITDQKKAEEALRESEERFRTFVDHAADGFFLLDSDDYGRVLDVNRQACESLGQRREELIGRVPLEFDTGLAPAEVAEMGLRVKAGETFALETRHRRTDGTEFPVELRIRPFQHGGRNLAVALARDITERKQALKALNESHDVLRAVVEGTPDAIFVKNLQGRYRMLNSAGSRVLGKPVDEVLGKDDTAVLPPQEARKIRQHDLRIMASGEAETFEEHLTAGGDPRTFLTTKMPFRDSQGHVIGLVGVARDVTETKRLEAQFQQAQKLEAIGRLAGGIAHDFNNLLTVIIGYSELMFSGLPSDDPNRASLVEVQKASEKAVTLTRQLLAFSRRQVLKPEVINLNPLLVDLCKMLRRLIGEDIELVQALDPALGRAKIDPSQFEQAVINLVVNARDAMPRAGRLTIETLNRTLDETFTSRHPELRPGNYVVVNVTDTGHGMDEQTKTRIFEPFFTTKEASKGTGLGLAMVYGFVKQSGGHIEVDSRPGHGTTFTLYLARTEEAEASTTAEGKEPGVPKGSETILLVEDEEAVRTLTHLVLESYGYTVLVASDGQHGLDTAERHPGTIDVLVTDVVMPRLGGRELADQLLRVRPNVRVVFMSGYTEDGGLRRGDGRTGTAFMHKPFSPLALARTVRHLLDN